MMKDIIMSYKWSNRSFSWGEGLNKYGEIGLVEMLAREMMNVKHHSPPITFK